MVLLWSFMEKAVTTAGEYLSSLTSCLALISDGEHPKPANPTLASFLPVLHCWCSFTGALSHKQSAYPPSWQFAFCMMPSPWGRKGAGVAMDAGGDCIGEEGRAPCKEELTSWYV